ncbi:hypothetical protein lerEdw1_005092 [Lerista edwardsae]|nr:hypothetical protein lerEdw1_005092 [Lerista edwardsae]
MGSLQQVVLAGARLLLLFGQSALLVEPSVSVRFEHIPCLLFFPAVTYLPSQLTKQVGETAVFTCNSSDANVSQFPVNWYKVSGDGQPWKVSELTGNGGAGAPKYAIAHVAPQTFEMKILNLVKNDSGTYYCGFISIFSAWLIRESNRANLTVTEKANATATPREEMKEEEEEEEEEEMGGRKESRLPLAVLGGAGLLLVLALLGYFLWDTFKRKRVVQKLQEENAPLEEEPPEVSVFTVDYGVLAFSSTERARAPPKRLVSEQTEYATIVFPQEGQDKRTQKQRTCPSRAQLN